MCCADIASLPAKRPRDQEASEGDAAALQHSPKRATPGPSAQPPPAPAQSQGLDAELLQLANVAAAEAWSMDHQQQQPQEGTTTAAAGYYHAGGRSVGGAAGTGTAEADEEEEEDYDEQAAAYAGRPGVPQAWGWCRLPGLPPMACWCSSMAGRLSVVVGGKMNQVMNMALAPSLVHAVWQHSEQFCPFAAFTLPWQGWDACSPGGEEPCVCHPLASKLPF